MSQRVRFSWQRVFRCPLTTADLTLAKHGISKVLGRTGIYPTVTNCSPFSQDRVAKTDPPLWEPGISSYSSQNWGEIASSFHKIKCRALSIFFHRITIKLEYFNKILRKMDFTEPDRIDLLYLLLPNHNGSIFSLKWEPITSMFSHEWTCFLSHHLLQTQG